MTWDYYPDGKLKSRSDDGVPVGKQVALVDNSDTANTHTTGTWTRDDTGAGYRGFDYHRAPAGTGATSFAWTPVVPADGTYEIFARYPTGVAGAASNATYTVDTGATQTPHTVNQTQGGGTWVSLGSHQLTAGTDTTVELSDNANGTVLADAVKLVRDNTGEADTEAKTFTHTYDANANLTALADSSPGAAVDNYQMVYNGLNQLTHVEEKLAAVVKNTTTFTYNENGAITTRGHDRQDAVFAYDTRDLQARARDRWPQLTEVTTRHHGAFAYVSGRRADGTTLPLFRLRYAGSATAWGFAIYLVLQPDFVILSGEGFMKTGAATS